LDDVRQKSKGCPVGVSTSLAVRGMAYGEARRARAHAGALGLLRRLPRRSTRPAPCPARPGSWCSGRQQSCAMQSKSPSGGGALLAMRPSLLLDDGGDGLGDDVDVAAIQGSHADAAAGHGVDAVLLA